LVASAFNITSAKGRLFMRKKVSVIGAGHVGATTAQRIVEKELADVVLVDIVEGMPQGKALDLMETAPVMGYNTKIEGSNSYELTANSDVVVITAGLARKPGMSRDDLLAKNTAILTGVAKEVARYSPNATIINVTNPLDAMTHLIQQVTGFSHERVMGMAGVLDSARFRTFIAMELNVSINDVTAFVLGGHGDTMVPLARYSTVAGIPITELMDAETIERLITRTRKAGGEIVGLLKTGSAYYSPSASAVAMVKAVLLDQKRIFPCTVYLSGEYGIDGLYVGVPIKLGAGGVEEIIEIKLTADEQAALNRSADAVRELVRKINL
jgi:malate dehydrogenase